MGSFKVVRITSTGYKQPEGGHQASMQSAQTWAQNVKRQHPKDTILIIDVSTGSTVMQL